MRIEIDYKLWVRTNDRMIPIFLQEIKDDGLEVCIERFCTLFPYDVERRNERLQGKYGAHPPVNINALSKLLAVRLTQIARCPKLSNSNVWLPAIAAGKMAAATADLAALNKAMGY